MTKSLKNIILIASALILLCLFIAWVIPSSGTLALGVFATMAIVVVVAFAILREGK